MMRRIFAVLIGALAGVALFSRGEGPFGLEAWLWIPFGAITGGVIVVAEYGLQLLPFGKVVGGLAGLGVGLTLAGLAQWVGTGVFALDPSVLQLTGLLVIIGTPYIGAVLGSRFGKERIASSGQAMEPAGTHGPYSKILDTSVIIDGRVSDLCETGFLEGTFLVPQFILNELQHIADSSDSLKRARGRRGLDILNKIQKMVDIDVRIVDDDFPQVREVDSKIVLLAKKVGAKVITNDLNLNKVAELQGVRVLNINELCNALRPVVLPGETIRVFVLKEGKEAGQGVAYLDDGTMIVVDNAKRCIGRNVDVIVTSVLQTTAGRMIFTKLREETEKFEYQVARG